MKNFQQNLLIVLALCLCALCSYQWYAQTLQTKELDNLARTIYQKDSAIQSYTNSIRNLDRQVAQMDGRISELKVGAKTNEQLVVTQKHEIGKLVSQNQILTNQITQYRHAVENLETKLKESYEGVSKQNDALKEVVGQRDEFVKKYNESVKDRNDVVTKYNELVQQVEKTRAGK